MKDLRELPDTIDWKERPSRFRRVFFFLVAVFLVLLFSTRTTVSYYVDALWYGSLGYGEVFRKTLRLEWMVFASFTAVSFVVLYGWFLFLRRSYRPEFAGGHTIVINGQPLKLPIGRFLNVLGLVASAIISLVLGSSMMSEWTTLALYWNAPTSAGMPVDPIFGKPLNFYLFTLPAWQDLSGWLVALAVIACLTAGFFLFVATTTKAIPALRESYSLLPFRSFSAAFAVLLVILAVRLYLNRFERLFEDHTIFSGVTYTDAHVILGGLSAVCLALLLGALLALFNAVARPKARWLVISVLPAIAVYFLVQIAAWYVASFIVKPNELVRERPYIGYNIDWTRRAYGLDAVSRHEFPADTTVEAANPAENQATLENIRLWDWRALQDTLRQIQEIRTYYDFPGVDVDRYTINGKLREVMMGVRELSVEKLPESSRNWINEKLIYTHGYGITMNPVNGFTAEGLPTLMLSNMPVQSTVKELSVSRPEIYFGELANTDVYVKTRQQEFNYPQGQTNSLTSYEGEGGIRLGGFFRRLLIAFDRGDLTKLPFSDDIGADSRLLMRRNLRERVSTLAPFLTYDLDPYIVVGEDGRLSWMMDAFTSSDNYPYARHAQLGDNSISYMRNSVKVVVDAYDGTTTFYVFDAQDPILAAYRKLFPSLFKDASQMPAGLRKHVRYPELLLKLQASMYGLYHMDNPEVFYNREDLWTVATEVGMSDNGEQKPQALEPNFVLMKLPGENSIEFVEILPFTPSNRNNLIGWVAGRSDGENYGKLAIYDFPKTKLVDGPLQIEARIDQNAQLSGQLTLWNQQGSRVRRGALLVIPCGKALLYAEPIYLQASQSPMPELRLVVLALQDKLAYGPTYEAALSSLFGGAAPSLTESAATAQPAAKGTEAAPAAPVAFDMNAVIAGAAKDLADYQRLTAEGKLGEAGQKLEQLKHRLDELNAHGK